MREQQERTVGYWAKHLDTLINQAYERALRNDGVTPRQWQVLSTLSFGGRSLGSLHETLGTFRCSEDDSIEAAMEALHGRGWLVEESGTWSLSPEGETASESLRRHVDGVRDQLLEGISAEDHRLTVDTLRRMCGNLSRSPDAD